MNYEPDILEAMLYEWECSQFLRRQLNDVRFYERAARGRVLEIGVGTGRVAKHLLDLGFDVTGLDIHPGMLNIARKKLGAQASLVQGDMRSLDLDEKYDTVIIPYNTFQTLTTREEQEACLAGIKRHLVPTGVFALEVTPFMLRDNESDWSHRATDRLSEDSDIVVAAWERIRQYPPEQINYYDMRYKIFSPNEEIVEKHLTLSLRTVFRYELEFLLERHKFKIEVLDGDYDGTPFHECFDEGMLIVARSLT